MLSDRVKFGDDFELDRRAFELRRAGRPLKLERIPLELLFLLMERRGELVSREEIIARIWGKDVFLDTDNSINAAIRKIRQVLKDDPENPVFVQTVTGKGYRFIAAMSETSASPSFEGGNRNASLEPRARQGAPLAPNRGQTEEATGAPDARADSSLTVGKKRAIAFVMAGAIVFFLAGYLYLNRKPKLTDKDTIVLADFTNTTGDPVFDGTLRQGMEAQLEQSPFLSLISEQRVQETLRLMGQPADARLTPELAREICERTASAAVLDGSIASLGSQYVLGLRATNCRSGDILDEEQVQAARKEEVLNALTRIAGKFRARAGESLSTVAKHDIPLAEATTPSLEALKSYSAAVNITNSAGFAASVPLLKRAIEIDPKFALAYAHLGLRYSSIGESVLSAENTTTAYQLRDHTSDREKFFITVNYERQVTGNLETAHQTLELWAETYPRDRDAHGLLSGFASQGLGKYEQSIKEAEKAIALDPDFTPGYVNIAFSHLYQDHLDKAANAIQQASNRQLETPELLILRYYIAFLKGDIAGMDREAVRANDEPGAEDWMAHAKALTFARLGQSQLARKMSRRAVDLALQAARPERAATFQTGAAVYEALYGNATAARQNVKEALNLSKGRDVEYAAAFTLALSGDVPHSQALADDLEKRFPEDTSVGFTYLPTLRALLALKRHQPAKAIELLETAMPYELAVSAIDFNFFFGGLYSADVRGEAYLAVRQSTEAAAEFQKILDHRGVVFGDPISALAHLQLGRAYTMSGDKTRARAAYQDFLTLWKDADPDIPILKEAKTEYAKLQ